MPRAPKGVVVSGRDPRFHTIDSEVIDSEVQLIILPSTLSCYCTFVFTHLTFVKRTFVKLALMRIQLEKSLALEPCFDRCDQPNHSKMLVG